MCLNQIGQENSLDPDQMPLMRRLIMDYTALIVCGLIYGPRNSISGPGGGCRLGASAVGVGRHCDMTVKVNLPRDFRKKLDLGHPRPAAPRLLSQRCILEG